MWNPSRVGFVALSWLLVSAGALSEEIKIGMLYPITGGGAISGSPAQTGHRMAVEEICLLYPSDAAAE